MKLDMDLVRELLLKIADSNEPMAFSQLVPGREEMTKEYEFAAYHMQMLIDDAGLVRGINASSLSGKNWLNLELTWEGQHFLDDIRDQTVWDKTKEGAKKLGSMGWDMLIDLAKTIMRAEAKKRLGIDI